MYYCIIIPAYNPDTRLIEYCRELINAGFKKIIIIDDGSRNECKPVFEELQHLPQITLLTHAVNMGKGRALKDAFNYYLIKIKPEGYNGVITADSDGQHLAKDVIRIAEEMHKYPDSLILGCRDFNGKNVPFKSKYGNRITKNVLKFLVGGSISDTQTGLRGIPSHYVEKCCCFPGERFEYETNMLIDSIRTKIDIREIEIETLYFDNNNETHFDTIKDSLAIYRTIFSTFLKFIISSFSSFIVDYVLFSILFFCLVTFKADLRIWISTIIARIFSSLFNYKLNKKAVFSADADNKTILWYYLLCICQMACSAYLVSIFNRYGILKVEIAKIVADTILFLISFQIQGRFIFRKRTK